MKTQYCAIIGDINKSRELPDRNRVQILFEDAVRAINDEFKNEVASKFLITLGDEFQGLLYNPAKSYHIVRRFQDIVKNISFAFGIGIGSLATKINPKSAIGMDGECFYNAREALKNAKEYKQEIVYYFADPSAPLVNIAIGLLEKKWKKLGDKQKQIMQMHKTNKSQNEIASLLNITQQFVSKTVNSQSFKEMQEIIDVLDIYFDKISEKSQQPK
jgi:hypothetical protein